MKEDDESGRVFDEVFDLIVGHSLHNHPVLSTCRKRIQCTQYTFATLQANSEGDTCFVLDNTEQRLWDEAAMLVVGHETHEILVGLYSGWERCRLECQDVGIRHAGGAVVLTPPAVQDARACGWVSLVFGRAGRGHALVRTPEIEAELVPATLHVLLAALVDIVTRSSVCIESIPRRTQTHETPDGILAPVLTSVRQRAFVDV